MTLTQGLAVASSEPVGARPRTVYAITDAGRDALQAWLAETSAPSRLESEALVRVFFADAGDLADLHAVLDEPAAHARDRLAVLDAMREGWDDDDASSFAERRQVKALAPRLQYDHHRAAAAWAAWAHEQVATWASTTDPGAWDWRGAFTDER